MEAFAKRVREAALLVSPPRRWFSITWTCQCSTILKPYQFIDGKDDKEAANDNEESPWKLCEGLPAFVRVTQFLKESCGVSAVGKVCLKS
ncbi:hypothetical protein E2C01_005495 [Portunus trituberculatus]|uniref:Uncharacterized protein n=1 Tax=Portunus trituberculatus TaxID=210409 RepID=A0A5B7CUJ1_PORTR|nr:hypothetical protein [Portunus trituberculatus]